MSTPEVGSGKVSIFPVFTGFRRATIAEVDGTTKAASARFTSGFRSAGTSAGKGFSAGFKASSGDAVKQFTADLAKASREVSTARLREQDAAGKVRTAEAQLADARRKQSADSAQVVRAEERLASAERALSSQQDTVTAATRRLSDAKLDLARASERATVTATRQGGVFAQLPGSMDSVGARSASRFASGFLDVLGGALGANIITGVGFAIGSGINQGIRAGVAYGFQGVDLSSNLEQSLGAIDSVFKAHSDSIKSYALSAANDVGLSQANYLQFATVVGAQLKNLKVPFDQVDDRTNSLIALGADLAAQFGGPTSDAVQALSSVLRGERDPIERYGVSIKQADINARLAAQGLRDLEGDQLRQAEIQATLAILYEQTADAQGTFFRESDTYAHKQQVLNAQLEQTQTKLGGYLLPAFTQVSEYANTTLLPRFDAVIDRVGPKLSDALDKSAPAAGRLLDKISPLVEDFLVWGGEEGLPRAIELLDQMADAAPGWAEALRTLTTPDNPLDDFNKTLAEIGDSINGENGWWNDFITFLNTPMDNPFMEGNPLEDRAERLANSFATGLKTADGWDRAKTTVDEQSALAAAEADKYQSDFHLSGQNYGDSLAAGIYSKRVKVGLAGLSIGREAVAQAKVGLKIASPSKEGTWIGENFGDSIADGILGRTSAVRSAAGEVANAALFSTAAASAGPAASTGGASGMPSMLAIYDVNNVLIGTMQVAAQGAVSQFREEIKAEQLAGGVIR